MAKGNKKSTTNKISEKDKEQLLKILKTRFEKYTDRHKGIKWNDVEAAIEKNSSKLWSLYEMERTGGEPDVINLGKKKGEFVFYDCSAESPAGRRSICYDDEALRSRKEYKPKNSALNMGSEMGIEILSEEEYRELQKTGKYDTKTSSWIKTPDAIRKLGGALFCDCRYNHIFTYHNGAESYYAARGFRGKLTV